MASKPEVRDRIVEAIDQQGGSVTVDRVSELRGVLGMGDVRRRDFNEALGSLRHNYCKLSISPTADGLSSIVRLVI